MQAWTIALICLGAAIIVATVIVVILIIIKKKKNNKTIDIKGKIKLLKEVA